MKAAVSYEIKAPMRVEEVTLDAPQDHEVLVKMVAAGTCHSDLHFLNGDIPVAMPVVMGHEGAGIVEKVGPGVTTLKPGDHVVLMVAFSCGQCSYCTEGRPTLCVENLPIQIMGSLPGGGIRLHKGSQDLHHLFGLACFAEYAVVHERSVVRIREDAPLDVACLLGCGTSTGIGAVLNTAGVKAGQSVAVYGCGGVGLSAVMAAKLAGAGLIIAVDTLEPKLEMAKALGADYVVNASRENPQQKAMELTAGRGLDHAVPWVGNADVIMQAFGSIRSGGKCVVVGLPPIGINLSIAPYELLQAKVLTGTTQGDITASVDIPRYVDLFMNGKLPLDKLITKSCRLDEINEAYAALQRGETIRTIIQF
jgi:S-(hydroxymethyl)glutathione dehydrogenase/alcohol dehydrogenase